jgi:hypothetical protein
MGWLKLFGFVTTLSASRSGCKNCTSDSTRELFKSIVRDAVTLTVNADQTRTSVGPRRFSIVITRIGSLKTRVNVASCAAAGKLLEETKGNDAVRSITQISAGVMSYNLLRMRDWPMFWTAS